MRLLLIGWLILNLSRSATAFVAPGSSIRATSSTTSALPDELGLPNDVPSDDVVADISDKATQMAGKATPSLIEYFTQRREMDPIVSPSTLAESEAKLAILKQNSEAFASQISSITLEDFVSYTVATLQLESYGAWYAAVFFLFLAAVQRQAGRDEAKADLVEKIVKGQLDAEKMVNEIKEAAEAEARAKAEKEAESTRREEEAAVRREAAAKASAEALAEKEAQIEEARRKREAAKQAVLEEKQRLEEARRAAAEEKKRVKEETIRVKRLEAEAKKLAMKEAKLKKEAEQRLAAEENRRLAEKNKIAEAEAPRLAAGKKRRKAEEQKLNEYEARRLKAEELTAAIEAERKEAEEKKLAAVEAKLREVEEEKKAVADAKRLKAELEAAVAEAKRKDAEAKQREAERLKVEEERAAAELQKQKSKKKKQKATPKKAKPAPKSVTKAKAPKPAKKADKEAPSDIEISLNASPLAKVLARERGIDITIIPGTGSKGRILADDVKNYRIPDDAAHKAASAEKLGGEYFFAESDSVSEQKDSNVVNEENDEKADSTSGKKSLDDWALLAPSTLKRKTNKQLSDYLTERGATVTDESGGPLKKADLIQAVIELSNAKKAR